MDQFFAAVLELAGAATGLQPAVLQAEVARRTDLTAKLQALGAAGGAANSSLIGPLQTSSGSPAGIGAAANGLPPNAGYFTGSAAVAAPGVNGHAAAAQGTFNGYASGAQPLDHFYNPATRTYGLPNSAAPGQGHMSPSAMVHCQLIDASPAAAHLVAATEGAGLGYTAAAAAALKSSPASKPPPIVPRLPIEQIHGLGKSGSTIESTKKHYHSALKKASAKHVIMPPSPPATTTQDIESRKKALEAVKAAAVAARKRSLSPGPRPSERPGWQDSRSRTPPFRQRVPKAEARPLASPPPSAVSPGATSPAPASESSSKPADAAAPQQSQGSAVKKPSPQPSGRRKSASAVGASPPKHPLTLSLGPPVFSGILRDQGRPSSKPRSSKPRRPITPPNARSKAGALPRPTTSPNGTPQRRRVAKGPSTKSICASLAEWIDPDLPGDGSEGCKGSETLFRSPSVPERITEEEGLPHEQEEATEAPAEDRASQDAAADAEHEVDSSSAADGAPEQEKTEQVAAPPQPDDAAPGGEDPQPAVAEDVEPPSAELFATPGIGRRSGAPGLQTTPRGTPGPSPRTASALLLDRLHGPRCGSFTTESTFSSLNGTPRPVPPQSAHSPSPRPSATGAHPSDLERKRAQEAARIIKGQAWVDPSILSPPASQPPPQQAPGDEPPAGGSSTAPAAQAAAAHAAQLDKAVNLVANLAYGFSINSLEVNPLFGADLASGHNSHSVSPMKGNSPLAGPRAAAGGPSGLSPVPSSASLPLLRAEGSSRRTSSPANSAHRPEGSGSSYASKYQKKKLNGLRAASPLSPHPGHVHGTSPLQTVALAAQSALNRASPNRRYSKAADHGVTRLHEAARGHYGSPSQLQPPRLTTDVRGKLLNEVAKLRQMLQLHDMGHMDLGASDLAMIKGAIAKAGAHLIGSADRGMAAPPVANGIVQEHWLEEARSTAGVMGQKKTAESAREMRAGGTCAPPKELRESAAEEAAPPHAAGSGSAQLSSPAPPPQQQQRSQTLATMSPKQRLALEAQRASSDSEAEMAALVMQLRQMSMRCSGGLNSAALQHWVNSTANQRHWGQEEGTEEYYTSDEEEGDMLALVARLRGNGVPGKGPKQRAGMGDAAMASTKHGLSQADAMSATMPPTPSRLTMISHPIALTPLDFIDE